MYEFSIRGTRWSTSQFLLVLPFLLFLYPIIVMIGAEGVSVNYTFMLVPFIVAMFTGKLRRPPDAILWSVAAYALIFAIATVYQTEYGGEFARRSVSFVLFLGIFSFALIRIDKDMVLAFKVAVIIAALYFSILAVVIFFMSGGNKLGNGAKAVVGSQRYAFVYLTAFWLLVLSPAERLTMRFIKTVLAMVCLVGLALSFARDSIVSLAVSAIAFGAWYVWDKPVNRWLKGVIFVATGCVAAFIILDVYFPVVFEFFGERLFDLLTNSHEVSQHLDDPNSSEGARVKIWLGVIDFVANNPLTGAGFLGVWVIKDIVVMGSAHNQYFDVLFRTGLIGFSIYVALLTRIGSFLWKTDRPLFWGFVAIMAYGMFEETFKESQGAFMLSFLIGVSSWQPSLSGGAVAHTELPGRPSPSGASL